MENLPLYNSRLLKNYVEYLRKFYPQIDPNDVLEYAGVGPDEVEEGAQWLTQKQIDRFHEMLSQLTDNPNLSREVGRFSVSGSALGPIRRYALGFLTPFMSYLVAEKLANNISQATTYKVKKLGRRKVEICVQLKAGVRENHFQCENRIGMLEILAKLFTKKMAQVEHPVCAHRGGQSCQYLVSWEKTPSYVWKLIRYYVLAVSFILGAGAFLFGRSRSGSGWFLWGFCSTWESCPFQNT